MAENKSDRPYLSLGETLCLIAYGIPEETGGSQWRRQHPGFMNRVPKKPVADHLAEAHSKVIHEEMRLFSSARRSLEQEMRRGTINPRGLHPHEAIQTVIPLVDRMSLVIDPFGGVDESGELHPDKISFNDQHTWRYLLFPSDEAFALWPPAGQETKPQIGRRPTGQSRQSQVWEEFDRQKGGLSFDHGELSEVARRIGKATGYAPNSVEKMIRPDYRELKQKQART